MNAKDIVHTLTENWSNWVPSATDIAWTEANVNRIKDGGYWVTSQGAFKVDKKAKKLVRVQGEQGEIFQKVSRVALKMGWQVVLPGGPDEMSLSA